MGPMLMLNVAPAWEFRFDPLLNGRSSAAFTTLEIEVKEINSFLFFIKSFSEQLLSLHFFPNQLLVSLIHDRLTITFSVVVTHPERRSDFDLALTNALVAIPV